MGWRCRYCSCAVAVIALLSSCGRLGFDDLPPDQISNDGGLVDAGMVQNGGSGAVAITTTPSQAARVGTTYQYDADSDAGGSEEWVLLEAPAGMTIDGATGEIQWLADEVGVFDVECQVTEFETGEWATQRWGIAVTPGGIFNGLRPNVLAVAVENEAFLGLARYPLSSALAGALADAPGAAAYLASCALAPDQVVATAAGPVNGELGLAPEWFAGDCDLGCQRAVSACLLARLNARGQRRPIVVRRAGGGAPPGPEWRHEATFLANLFLARPVRVACPQPGARLRACMFGACPFETRGAPECDRPGALRAYVPR